MVLAPPLRPSLWFVTLLACSPACSVVNTDHCGNQDGHVTCLQRDSTRPYCSLCDAANNGCRADPPEDKCLAGTSPLSAGDSTTTGLSSTTVDPTTSTATTSTETTAQTTTTGIEPTTTDNTSTSTSSVDTTTTTDTSTTTTDATTTTGTSTGDNTTGTTTGGPACGNNKVEGDEVCDGTDFNGETCKTLAPTKWGGGSLTCFECSAVNDNACCVGLNGKCGVLAPDAALPCCGNLLCKLDGANGYRCLSK